METTPKATSSFESAALVEAAAAFARWRAGAGDRDRDWRGYDDVMRPRLMAYCGRLMDGRHADAEDAVQDTFVRVLEHAAKAPAEDAEALCRWTCRIAKGICLNMLRGPRGQAQSMDDVDAPVPGPGTATQVRNADARATVRARVGRLPQAERVFVRLHELRGRTYDTIARRFGKSPDQVRRAVEWARKKVSRDLSAAGLGSP